MSLCADCDHIHLRGRGWRCDADAQYTLGVEGLPEWDSIFMCPFYEEKKHLTLLEFIANERGEP